MTEPSFYPVAPSSNPSFFFQWGHINVAIPWHYHPEVELIYLKEGSANSILGEKFHFLQEGDLAMLGINLPHAMQPNREFTRHHPGSPPFGLVMKFREDFMGESFFLKPALSRVLAMLQQSRQGIRFSRASARRVTEQLEAMHGLSEPRKLVALLDILVTLSEQNEWEVMTPPGYQYTPVHAGDRMRYINQYVYDHFKEPISIRDIASVASMTETSFCRYFKSRTNRNFSHYLNEIRISYACNLLRTTNYRVTEVCYESGFNALPYFTRQFKKITDVSPQQFQRQMPRAEGMAHQDAAAIG